MVNLGFWPPAISLPIVRKLVHHRRKLTPRNPLRVSSLPPSPRKRSLTDNQCANLFILSINLQVQRRPRPRQLHDMHVRLNRVFPDYALFTHRYLLMETLLAQILRTWGL